MPSKDKRKLAAIMFTDIAGYTEQISKDEAGVIRLIQKQK
jgi:class 3 adenylate cyclase